MVKSGESDPTKWDIGKCYNKEALLPQQIFISWYHVLNRKIESGLYAKCMQRIAEGLKTPFFPHYSGTRFCSIFAPLRSVLLRHTDADWSTGPAHPVIRSEQSIPERLNRGSGIFLFSKMGQKWGEPGSIQHLGISG